MACKNNIYIHLKILSSNFSPSLLSPLPFSPSLKRQVIWYRLYMHSHAKHFHVSHVVKENTNKTKQNKNKEKSKVSKNNQYALISIQTPPVLSL